MQLMMAFSRNRSNDLQNKQVSTVKPSSTYNLRTCGSNLCNDFNSASQADLLQTFSNLSFKLHYLISNIWFNKQCLSHHVTPTYAKQPTKQTTFAARRTQHQAQTLRIRNEIRSQYIKKDGLNRRLMHTHLQITNLIQMDNFLTFYDNLKQDIDRQMTTKYNKLRNKLDKLINKNTTNDKPTNFHARTVNLTDTRFTTLELELLDKGLKHNLNNSNRDKDIERLTVDTELAINRLPQDQQTHARHTVVDILQKVRTNLDKTKHSNTDTRTLKQIQNKLKDNDLTITKSDKGNATVIIKTTDYVNKTVEFISTNGHKQLDRDPTNKFQTDVRNVINRSSLIIPPKTKYRFLNPNPSTPSLKALPKIHKPEIPIRPIVNYRPAPAYKLSQHLATIVKDYTDLDDKHTLRNSHELTTSTANLTLTTNSRLISLDVTNLYPSIPVNETLGLLEDKLLLNHDRQTVQQLLDLLRTTLKQNFFNFNGTIYLATDGLGMGHPTSSIMSEVFMQSLEDVYVPKLVERFGVAFYKRYVDDCFLVVDSEKDTTDDLLTYMNGLHPNIKFTIEKETDGQLNFMDLTASRIGDKLTYKIYRKPTATDHTIHATSNHPTQHKLAAYRSMIHRLRTIPMTSTNYQTELNTIYDIAKNNGYNKRTIDKLIAQHTDKTNKTNPTPTNQTTETNSQWTALTYVGKETYRLTNFFNKHDIRTAFKTTNNIGNKLKRQRTDNDVYDNSGIYKLTCNDCDQVYIGRTGRNLRTRYKEHLRSYKYNRTDSNYANHLRTHGHEPDSIDRSMTLLHREQKGPRLDVLEKLEIYKHRTSNNTIINEQLLTNSDVTFSALRQATKRKRDDPTNTTDAQNKRPRLLN